MDIIDKTHNDILNMYGKSILQNLPLLVVHMLVKTSFRSKTVLIIYEQIY